jgi:pantoate--beta-alanine ligase
MIVFKLSADLKKYLSAKRKNGRSVGFVPTMGALHKGHVSLIKQSKMKTDLTVCSIFVNPIQFNNPEDFEKYPSTIEHDVLKLEENGCNILFLPSVQEIYPDEASTHKHYELGYLEEILEGKFRPGHFQGVCLVMERLLDIVQPDVLFLGQKDYQQCLVIKKLISRMDMKVSVMIEPIVREKNGLAMSSRNLRLTIEEREAASALHKTLVAIMRQLPGKNFDQLKNQALEKLRKHGFRIDYLELASAKDLQIISGDEHQKDLVLLVAAYISNVRLIDNILVNDGN